MITVVLLPPGLPGSPAGPGGPGGPDGPGVDGTGTGTTVVSFDGDDGPGGPGGPDGPGTATGGEGGGATTVFSHAFSPSAANSAADSIEYFMIVPMSNCKSCKK